MHELPVALSHPVQPVNVEPELADTDSCTLVPEAYEAVPVLPLHARVPLLSTTVPEPLPALITVSVILFWASWVTVNVCPAIDIVPVRDVVPVFAETV